MKEIKYFVDMRPYSYGRSLHCQICNAVVFPLTFDGKKIVHECKCTKEELKKRKVYK